jgi:hypothetical protein
MSLRKQQSLVSQQFHGTHDLPSGNPKARILCLHEPCVVKSQLVAGLGGIFSRSRQSTMTADGNRVTVKNFFTVFQCAKAARHAAMESFPLDRH